MILKHVRRNVGLTELNWHGLVFDGLANGQALLIGWRVRDCSHVGCQRRWTVPTVMHHCLLVGQFIKN